MPPTSGMMRRSGRSTGSHRREITADNGEDGDDDVDEYDDDDDDDDVAFEDFEDAKNH